MVIGYGLKFVVALLDSGKEMTWDEAMSRYGNSLPSKEQAEVMFIHDKSINKAIIAFDGDKDPEKSYWTQTEYDEDSSMAHFVDMSGGGGYASKNLTHCVRTVSPIPAVAK